MKHFKAKKFQFLGMNSTTVLLGASQIYLLGGEPP